MGPVPLEPGGTPDGTENARKPGPWEAPADSRDAPADLDAMATALGAAYRLGGASAALAVAEVIVATLRATLGKA